MAYQLPPDVQHSVTTWIASGRYSSEEEVLRDALRALNDEQDDGAAIDEALIDLEQGDPGIGVRQVFQELREQHGIQRQS